MDDPLHFGKGLGPQLFGVKWRRSGQQFVQQHAQRVDVAARIDIQASIGLFGTHVRRRADELTEIGEQRFFRQSCQSVALAMPKSITLSQAVGRRAC